MSNSAREILESKIQAWSEQLEICRKNVAEFARKADSFAAAIEGAQVVLAELSEAEKKTASEVPAEASAQS